MDTGIVVRNRTKKRIDAPSPDASFTPVTIGYETARTPQEVVYVLTRYLANRCDGASTPDGVGFNKIDTRFGHKLAEIPFEEWSPRQLWAARKMLTRYKNRQLKQWWESVPDIPEPERPQELIKHREEYDRYQRRSNPGYQREPDFRELSLVTVDGQQAIQLRQSYDPRLVDAIKSLPHRKYDKDKKAWYCFLHLENLEKTLDFAIDWGYDIPQDVLDACNAVMADFADSIDMSHAATSDFRVTGINGELFPFQVAGVEYAQKKGNTLIADEMGLGKGLAHGTGVLTPHGFAPIEELKEGDFVIGKNGMPTKVVGVFPQGNVQRYRVTFNDGMSVVTDGPHRWSVQHVRNGHRNPDGWQVKTTEELMTCLRDGAGNATWRIPMVSEVQGEDRVLPIDPYLLGVLLGDGGITNRVMFSTADEQIVDEVKSRVPTGVEVRHVSGYDYRIKSRSRGVKNSLREALSMLDLMGKGSHDKFVPDLYLHASAYQRLMLLRGLMDTDGSAREDGINEFCSVSAALADAVAFLAQSFGGVARRSEKRLPNGGIAHRVNIKTNVCPFLIDRKADRWTPPTKYGPSRIIVAIDPEDIGPTTCIKVSAADELFVTEHCIVTHNTLQALAAISMSEQFPAIVICPASLKQNWAREIRKWLPNRTVQVLGSVLHRITQYDGTPISDIVVINYNIRTLEKWYDRLVELNPKAIICDEAHALKNPGASQSKKVADLIEETNARLLFLSGTPVMNRPMEFWQLLKLLGYGQVMGGYNAYKARYDTKNVQKLRELNTRARSTFLIRRRKEDVLTDLPPKLYSVVPLEITNRDEYLKTERDVAAYFATKKSEDERWLADIRREAIRLNYEDKSISVDDIVDAAVKQKYREHYSVAAMNERLLRWEALKQRALEGKMKAALEWITDFLDNSDQKLVLFGVHKTEVRALAERFSKKYGAVYITGEIPPDERLPIVDTFQNDPNCRLIVGNMKAMGEGLTLTAASNVAFIEFGWNPAQHGQAEDRCHRIGQNDSVTVYSLVARDTIDEEIVALIEEKRAIADAIQDGDTGVTVSMMAALSDRMEKRRLGQVAGTDDDWSDDDEAA